MTTEEIQKAKEILEKDIKSKIDHFMQVHNVAVNFTQCKLEEQELLGGRIIRDVEIRLEVVL